MQKKGHPKNHMKKPGTIPSFQHFSIYLTKHFFIPLDHPDKVFLKLQLFIYS